MYQGRESTMLVLKGKQALKTEWHIPTYLFTFLVRICVALQYLLPLLLSNTYRAPITFPCPITILHHIQRYKTEIKVNRFPHTFFGTISLLQGNDPWMIGMRKLIYIRTILDYILLFKQHVNILDILCLVFSILSKIMVNSIFDSNLG